MARNLKTAGSFAIFTLLLGCVASNEPRMQDNQGRAVIPVSNAVEIFMNSCYNTSGKGSRVRRAVQRIGNFTITDSTLSVGAFTAAHTSQSIDVISLGDSGCGVSFDSGQPGNEAGAAATIMLLAATNAQGMNDGVMRGSLTLRTAKGSIMVRNREAGAGRRAHGVSLLFIASN